MCREVKLRVTAKNKNNKDIKGDHLNLLEGRHKVAWGALCHVDVAGEQGVGEASEQPAMKFMFMLAGSLLNWSKQLQTKIWILIV